VSGVTPRLLVDMMNYTMAEAAEILEVSESAMKTRTFRARAALRATMAERVR